MTQPRAQRFHAAKFMKKIIGRYTSGLTGLAPTSNGLDPGGKPTETGSEIRWREGISPAEKRIDPLPNTEQLSYY